MFGSFTGEENGDVMKDGVGFDKGIQHSECEFYIHKESAYMQSDLWIDQ